MHDNKIIELYFSRDENAIKETNIKYGTRLHCISRSITNDSRDAEECVNDTYLRVWNTVPPERPRFFFAFLSKIVRNLSLDKLDKRSASKRNAIIIELSAELSECLPSPNSNFDDDIILSGVLDSFLRSLDKDVQYIFIRRYFFSESVKTISNRTGRSETAITSLLYRCRKQLKEKLESEGINV